MLERNGHGGDWVTASKMFGYEADKFVDFSANINPLGPPKGLKDLLFQEWSQLSHYPDPEARELRETISHKFDISTESILIGNGAAEVIDLVVRYLLPRKAVVVDPTFSEYAEALNKVGARILSVPATEENNFMIPVDMLMAACEEADLLFLGQPNNPTGRWVYKEALIPLLKKAALHHTTLVLDEAFIDFFPNEREISFIREAERSKHVIVIRSMTKFYAIPGLRLGFAAAHPDHIEGMKRLQVPWSVNHLAQRAGVMVLNDQEYEVLTRETVANERSWLLGELQRLGCTTYHGQANFILIRLDHPRVDALTLQQKLGEQGILIRRCVNFVGLDDRFFRIAVRNRAHNQQLIGALETALIP